MDDEILGCDYQQSVLIFFILHEEFVLVYYPVFLVERLLAEFEFSQVKFVVVSQVLKVTVGWKDVTRLVYYEGNAVNERK